MNTKPEAVMVLDTRYFLIALWKDSLFCLYFNKEINPLGRNLQGLWNEDQKLQKAAT